MVKKAKRVSQPGANSEIVCGFHAVSSALSRGSDQVVGFWVDRNRHDSRIRSLLDLAQQAGVDIEQVDQKTLDLHANGIRHQGVVAKLKLSKQKDEHGLQRMLDDLIEPPLLLVLDQIQDPHNLGACLRTADGAGVHGVILPRDGAAPVNETVRRVAAGAAERQQVFYVTNLARCLEQLQTRGIWITGCADESDLDMYRLDFTDPVAIVLGAEGKGLRRLTREHCDKITRIPMAGSVSSLNVSVATGVILFEAVRQRRKISTISTAN